MKREIIIQIDIIYPACVVRPFPGMHRCESVKFRITVNVILLFAVGKIPFDVTTDHPICHLLTISILCDILTVAAKHLKERKCQKNSKRVFFFLFCRWLQKFDNISRCIYLKFLMANQHFFRCIKYKINKHSVF